MDSFRRAAQTGLDAFERYFRVQGAHYCWSVGRDGKHDSTEVNAYGYAFIVLAQATAASALNRPDLAQTALATWQFAVQELGDSDGGLEWRRPTHRSDVPSEAKSQNPLMHSFEALMAVARCEVADAQIVSDARASATRLLNLISKLSGFDTGRLVEWHTGLETDACR